MHKCSVQKRPRKISERISEGKQKQTWCVYIRKDGDETFVQCIDATAITGNHFPALQYNKNRPKLKAMPLQPDIIELMPRLNDKLFDQTCNSENALSLWRKRREKKTRNNNNSHFNQQLSIDRIFGLYFFNNYIYQTDLTARMPIAQQYIWPERRRQAICSFWHFFSLLLSRDATISFLCSVFKYRFNVCFNKNIIQIKIKKTHNGEMMILHTKLWAGRDTFQTISQQTASFDAKQFIKKRSKIIFFSYHIQWKLGMLQIIQLIWVSGAGN